MLSQTIFPPDIRLEKEIRSLVKADYNITVICNQYERNKKPNFEYCDIIRIEALFNSVKLNKVINFPFFLNPRYLFTVLTTIFRFKPNFIHAHDLPMVPIAILYGKLFRLPIIFDMHENYPQALKQFNKKGFINFFFKNHRFATILEKCCLKHSDRIIVVIEENKERLLKIGMESRKIFVVSNTVDLTTFLIPCHYSSIVDEYKEMEIILYSGAVSPDRGLEIPILSMRELRKNSSSILLMIVGDGPHIPQLKLLVNKNELENNVAFISWPGHHNVVSYISLAKICTIPQPSNEFINNTIPHKLFEYMCMRKPILTSDALPLKRIINETEAGEVFKSNDPDDFALKISQMLGSDKNYAENGRMAVENKYNWSRDSEILLEVYKSFFCN